MAHFGPKPALNPEMLGNVVLLKIELEKVAGKMPILSIGSLFRPHSKKHPVYTHRLGCGSRDLGGPS